MIRCPEILRDKYQSYLSTLTIARNKDIISTTCHIASFHWRKTIIQLANFILQYDYRILQLKIPLLQLEITIRQLKKYILQLKNCLIQLLELFPHF